jgi:hypothetical protein
MPVEWAVNLDAEGVWPGDHESDRAIFVDFWSPSGHRTYVLIRCGRNATRGPVFWVASAQPVSHPEPEGAGRPAPRPSGSVQPPGEGTGGASGAAAPFGEEGVSEGDSGLAGA